MIAQFGVPQFAQMMFGGGPANLTNFLMGNRVATVGDVSSHGGVISTSNTDGTVKCGGLNVAVTGANHICPVPFHGTTPVTSIITKTFVNGILVITWGAQAACGAVILPSRFRRVIAS